jgi:nucleoside 2-deoxyribosyltransferase
MRAYREVPKLRVYFAAPLFSQAERVFNEAMAKRLEQYVKVYLPQRDGGLMAELINGGLSAEAVAKLVFTRDVDAMHHSDCLLAILDGRAIDEGVALEIGVAYASGKECIGLQTDVRRLASWGNNPMITGALQAVFTTIEDCEKWLRQKAEQQMVTLHQEPQAAKPTGCGLEVG